MNWMDWVIIGFFAFGGICTILTTGKPRTIITPPQAAIIVIIQCALIVGLIVTHQ